MTFQTDSDEPVYRRMNRNTSSFLFVAIALAFCPLVNAEEKAADAKTAVEDSGWFQYAKHHLKGGNQIV